MFKTPFLLLTSVLLAASVVSAADAPKKGKAKPKPPVAKEGYTLLYDGKSLDGWMVKPDTPPQVWVVDRDGSLARKPKSSILFTEQAYGDFILEFEFKVSAACNSGLFFRTDPDNAVQGGFEIQIFDSHGQEMDKHSSGALYDAAVPLANPVKPAGEWNHFKIQAKGPKVVVHINKVKVQDVNLDDWPEAGMNPDGTENKFKTALKDLPRTGHIGFQDHGHNVWFRNIQIKPL